MRLGGWACHHVRKVDVGRRLAISQAGGSAQYRILVLEPRAERAEIIRMRAVLL